MISYQFGQIEQSASEINGISQKIDGQLQDLKQVLQPMVATWQGDSAQAYQAQQAEWDNAYAELNQVLATIARVVADGNNEMAAVNSRAAASWGGM